MLTIVKHWFCHSPSVYSDELQVFLCGGRSWFTFCFPLHNGPQRRLWRWGWRGNRWLDIQQEHNEVTAMVCFVEVPVLGPSSDWAASVDVWTCVSASLGCSTPIWLPDAPTAMTGVATGTEVDSSLFRTSRTCLELTAIGSSTGVSAGQADKRIQCLRLNSANIMWSSKINTTYFIQFRRRRFDVDIRRTQGC